MILKMLSLNIILFRFKCILKAITCDYRCHACRFDIDCTNFTTHIFWIGFMINIRRKLVSRKKNLKQRTFKIALLRCRCSTHFEKCVVKDIISDS